MQAGIINALLVVVAVLAAVLRAVGQRANKRDDEKAKNDAVAHSGGDGAAAGVADFGCGGF